MAGLPVFMAVFPSLSGRIDMAANDPEQAPRGEDHRLKSLDERLKEAHRAEEIVDQEVQVFCSKMRSREVVPTIVQLRDTLEKIRRDEIERYRKNLKDMTPDQQAAVDQITQALVNKILHHPISELKQMAHDPQGSEMADLVRRIFNIKPQ